MYKYTYINTEIGGIYAGYKEKKLYVVSAKHEHCFLDKFVQLHGCMPEFKHNSYIETLVIRALDGETIRREEVQLDFLTPFQRKVLFYTTEIPKGQVETYATLATKIGHPKAYRAVGTALARNPVPIVIPCHRIIRNDGRVGQYSGGYDDFKEKILCFEGALQYSEDTRMT